MPHGSAGGSPLSSGGGDVAGPGLTPSTTNANSNDMGDSTSPLLQPHPDGEELDDSQDLELGSNEGDMYPDPVDDPMTHPAHPAVKVEDCSSPAV